jgi:cold shock protein
MKEQGVVAWFNSAKGFGFIQRLGGPDIFVHHSCIEMPGYRKLDGGQAVEFEVGVGPTGRPQAVKVVRL